MAALWLHFALPAAYMTNHLFAAFQNYSGPLLPETALSFFWFILKMFHWDVLAVDWTCIRVYSYCSSARICMEVLPCIAGESPSALVARSNLLPYWTPLFAFLWSSIFSLLRELRVSHLRTLLTLLCVGGWMCWLDVLLHWTCMFWLVVVFCMLAVLRTTKTVFKFIKRLHDRHNRANDANQHLYYFKIDFFFC